MKTLVFIILLLSGLTLTAQTVEIDSVSAVNDKAVVKSIAKKEKAAKKANRQAEKTAKALKRQAKLKKQKLQIDKKISKDERSVKKLQHRLIERKEQLSAVDREKMQLKIAKANARIQKNQMKLKKLNKKG